jgi:hypothetical protein
LGEGIDDLFGDSVSKELVLRINGSTAIDASGAAVVETIRELYPS